MEINQLKEKLRIFIETLGYELYDLEYKKRKTNSILTVYIDRDEGIKLDDCVAVTKELNPYMDEIDPIEGEYFLEVSSPGAEKELRTVQSIEKSIGKFVHIETDEQKIEGELTEFTENEVTLKVRNKIIKINYNEVNLIRLAIKF
ncbi:ribosome maturation factor RimP [Mycoplasmatota bacterium WC30]